MSETTMTFSRKIYHRERYACRLRIRRDRFTEIGHLKDAGRIAEVMTRWLRRCVRDEPVVMGTATIEVINWGQELPNLRAIAPAYRDVKPEHIKALTRRVDDPKAYYTEVLDIDR